MADLDRQLLLDAAQVIEENAEALRAVRLQARRPLLADIEHQKEKGA